MLLVVAVVCAPYLVPQRQRSAAGNVIEVSSFGAVPNDGVNDATAINNAIASAGAGDTVHFSTGTYDLAAEVITKSNLTLQGSGSTTILRRTGTATTPLLGVENVSNVELTAFVLDGNNSTRAQNGIYAATANNINLHDLTVRNLAIKTGFGPHGILFANDVTNSFVQNNTFSNIGTQSVWGAGVRVAWRSNNVQVTGNTVTNTGRGGILCDDNSTDLVIRNNTVTGSGQNNGTGLGIEIFGGCDRAIVENNNIDHWLSVDSSNNLAVRNNVISDHTGVYKYTGLELVDAHDDVFTDNLIDGGQQIGISISGPQPKQRVYWGHNTLRAASTWGIQIQGETGGASDMVFAKNTFEQTIRSSPNTLYAPQGHGVRFNGDAWNIVFQDNDIKNNLGEGVQLQGGNLHDLSFVDNRITGNALAAAENLGVNGLLWSNNTVSGNGVDNQLVSTKNAPAAWRLSASESLAAPDIMVGDLVHITFGSQEKQQTFEHVLWDFGDGIPSTELDAAHVYWTPGDYRVTRIGWDAAGQSWVDEAVVTVVPEPTMMWWGVSLAAISLRRRRRS
jgi:parallel beta-helix repeat protein